jgi:hypothetical protein
MTCKKNKRARLKSRRAVLLDVLNSAVCLPDKECEADGLERIGMGLENFLHEVIVYMRQEGVFKYFLPEIPDIGEISQQVEAVEQKRARLRIRKVGSIYREGGYARNNDGFSDNEFIRTEGSRVPYIRMTGKWLEQYGFTAGKRYAVYPGDRQLILRESGLCVKSGSSQ